MYIDEALKNVLHDLDDILIPGREARKMQSAKDVIQDVINAVQIQRQQAQQAQQETVKEGQQHDD